MKILITTDWYAPVINGVVTSVKNLESELRKHGHEVRILTLSRNRKTYEMDSVFYIGSLSVGLIYPNARMKSPIHSRYMKKLTLWKPDIIHSQCEFSTFLVARKIAKILGVPIVHTYHTVYEDYTHYFSPNKKLGKKAVARFSRWVSESCAAVIVPTAKVKDLLIKYKLSCPVQVVPTGICCEKFYAVDKRCGLALREELGFKKDDLVAVYLGRLAVEKNVEELILMHEKFPDARLKLLVVGDGPHGEALKTMVSKRGLDGKIFFTGMISPDRVGEYYKCADIFVSASTSETQGLTYVEALASGLPVICRRDKCLEEVVFSGQNGFLYITQDEYFSCINALLHDRQMLCKMSEQALAVSRNFSSEAFGNRILKVYQTVLGGGK